MTCRIVGHRYGEPVSRALFPGDLTVHRYCRRCPHFQFRFEPDLGWLDAAPSRSKRHRR